MENILYRCGPLPIGTIITLALVLMLSIETHAYITAPLAKVCTRDEDLDTEWDLGRGDAHVFQQRSLRLEGSGHRSAARLSAKMSDPPCALIIEVPKETHAIAVSLNNFPEGIFCPLSLWFHEGTNKEEAWSLDLCDGEKRRLLALYPEVYPHRVTLRWNPVFPAKAVDHNNTRYNRVLASEDQVEIVATAVGRGSVCEEDTRVLCWKIMKESLCVSEELACDGFLNCPRPGNDESESMCPQSQSGDLNALKGGPMEAWDIVADHIRQMMAVRAGDREAASPTMNWSVRKSGGSVSKTKSAEGATDDEAEERRVEGDGRGKADGLELGAFSRVGPSTFVLLCMLACGSLLLLCGLWECCCQNNVPVHSLSPRGSMAAAGGGGGQQTTTTTVVIISSSTQPPPQYEDLEQPPDYMELFPGRSKSTVV